jgi:hypothetical protein
VELFPLPLIGRVIVAGPVFIRNGPDVAGAIPIKIGASDVNLGNLRDSITGVGQVTIRAIDSSLVEDSEGNLVPEDPSYDYLDGYPTYTGHYTQWFGENGNNQNGAATFTFNVKLTGSDGSRIQAHVAAHFNVTPGGVEHEFEIERCS